MAETTTRIPPSQVAKFLEGVHLPANKRALLNYVRERTQAVMHALEALPDGEYHTMADVMKGLGHHEE